MSTAALALRDPVHRVSARAPLVWASAGIVRWAVAAGVLYLLTGPWHWFGIPAWVWPVLAAVAVCYCVAMPIMRYRIHRWETTDGAVYTQTGWWTTERRVAPMSRVQTVDVSQGPVSRMLGLATVTVTTASAKGPLHISGLTREVAGHLVAELTRRTEGQTGDAT